MKAACTEVLGKGVDNLLESQNSRARRFFAGSPTVFGSLTGSLKSEGVIKERGPGVLLEESS